MNTQSLNRPRTDTNAAAAEVQRRSSHPPSTVDRLAMRVGLALLLWGRRDHGARSTQELDRSRRTQLNTLERERLARERAWRAAADVLMRR